MLRRTLDKFVCAIRQQANLPAQIRLWSGEVFNLGDYPEPKIVITVCGPMALPHLISPSLTPAAWAKRPLPLLPSRRHKTAVMHRCAHRCQNAGSDAHFFQLLSINPIESTRLRLPVCISVIW